LAASIVWFRNDLRLADNPALIAGLGSGGPVIPVFVLDEETSGIRRRGAASRCGHSTRRCARSDPG
jgi:deoxyribodipyrimidine photo-lyase